MKNCYLEKLLNRISEWPIKAKLSLIPIVAHTLGWLFVPGHSLELLCFAILLGLTVFSASFLEKTNPVLSKAISCAAVGLSPAAVILHCPDFAYFGVFIQFVGTLGAFITTEDLKSMIGYLISNIASNIIAVKYYLADPVKYEGTQVIYN